MGEINYTTINHTARKKLGISLNEYAVCDLIYHLSNHPKSSVPGWCYASKATLADTLDIERRSIIRIINRLIEKDLITRDETTSYLKTTDTWFTSVILTTSDKKSHIVSKKPLTNGDKKSQGVTKSHSDKKSHNNNIYNNIDIERDISVSSVPVPREQKTHYTPDNCTGKQPKVCGKCSKCSLIPCTPLQLWELANKEDIWIDDVKRKHKQILSMITTDEIKKYKVKTMFGTLRTWLQRDVKMGYIKQMDEIQRLLLPDEHPDMRRKMQESILFLTQKGLI